MRLERIWAQQEKDRQVAEALAKFAAMQTGLKSEKTERPCGKEDQAGDGVTNSTDNKADMVTKKIVPVDMENKTHSGRKKQATRSSRPSWSDGAARPPIKAKATAKMGSTAQHRHIKAN